MSASLSLKNFLSKLGNGIGHYNTKSELEKLGKEAISIIVRRTRLGYGVERSGADKQLLKSMRPHARSYTQWRLKNAFRLHELTTPKKVNLTLTGKMLDLLRITEVTSVKSNGSGSLKIGVSGNHPWNGESYEDIANSLAKKGWKFLNLSKAETNQLTRFYRNNLVNYLRNIRLSK